MLIANIYDLIMSQPEAHCLGAWRTELLARARGRVLEIGAGTGINTAHYTDAVTELVLLEPDETMRAKLTDRASSCAAHQITYVHDFIEEYDAPDHSFDAIVCTLVLCSVPDPSTALSAFKRLLRPGGEYIFIEHVASERGTAARKLQNTLDPVWKFCAGNCHLTRETEATIEASGFVIEEIARDKLCRAPSALFPTIRGVATPR